MIGLVRSDKIDTVNYITERLKSSQSVVMADFRGLTVAEMTSLRVKLRQRGVELRVVKNRLGRIALTAAEYETPATALVGNTAWAFGMEDAASPAKILSDFARDNGKLVIKGGVLEGKAIDLAMVKALADLPSREELLARMAGCLLQPATKMASTMQAGVTKIAYAFNALAAKMEPGAGA